MGGGDLHRLWGWVVGSNWSAIVLDNCLDDATCSIPVTCPTRHRNGVAHNVRLRRLSTNSMTTTTRMNRIFLSLNDAK